MNKTIVRSGPMLLVLVLTAAVLAPLACTGDRVEAGRYHCPMHPTYIADKAGDCPVCGMRLVPLEEKTAPTTVPAYSCPMHPEVTSDRPGRCPKCGMKLTIKGEPLATPPAEPVSHPPEHTAGAEAPAGGGRKILYYLDPMDPTATSPVPAKDSMGMAYVPVYSEEEATGGSGHAAVEISAAGLRLAGVQTVAAVREPLVRSVRTVGSVTTDETRIRHVHTKISGWVEKLFVNYTGQEVREGEPILSIYSQELLASQEEYLRARDISARFGTSTLPEVRSGGEDIAKAARRRLELFDVPDSLIDELERTGKVQRTVTLESPVSGLVTVKGVFEGQQVEPAMEIFTVTDLSRVWIEAEFYEFEAGALRLGQAAAVSLPYEPATRLDGRVAFISPTLNAETRTLSVRLEFPNPGMALRPGMFANIELRAESVEGTVVPDSAVLDTGERQIVFVRTGRGRFEPRGVTVGVRSLGKAEILSGVAVGEQVVVRANFLLDSESRLRAALSAPAHSPATGDWAQGTKASNHVH